MRSSRPAVLLLVFLAVLGAVPSTAAADSGSVELDAALDDQTESDELSFTFTADANATVTATESVSRDGGNVRFAFEEWERTDGSGSGGGESWQVRRGGTYRVTYRATAQSGASEGTHSATVRVESQFGGSVASESLSLSVDVLSPRFGDVRADRTTLTFTDDDDQTESVSAEIPNDGRGAMKPTDVSFSGVPGGFDVDAVDLPDRIDGSDTEEMELDVTVDPSVSEGTYAFYATVSDNLGNSDRFSVTVTVSKPAVADADDVDVGDVLVGDSRTETFTVEEVAGFSGIGGVSGEITGSESDGDLSLSGLSYVRTAPGGSDTAELTVSASDDAGQHETLTWEVELTAYDEGSPTQTFDVEARVIYPARLGEVTMSDTTMTFDRPKSEVSSQTQTTSVELDNGGDLSMTVESVTATTDTDYIDVAVRGEPSSVDGLGSGTATLVYSADPETPEGTYDVTVTVRTDRAGRKTVTREITVEHGVELGVETNAVEFGETVVTKERTESVRVSELLEYERVADVTLTKVSGPDRWLTVAERPPSALEPGERAPLVFALQFDTQAELYRPYSWTFKLSGSGVETKRITVSAAPKPYSFDQITEPLREQSSEGGWRGSVADGMSTSLDRIESRLQSGDSVPGDDLSAGLAAGRGTQLFIESASAAERAQSNGNYVAAQTAIVRAAAAHQSMRTYVGDLSTTRVRRPAEDAVEAGDGRLDELVAEQVRHYRRTLAAENASTIQRARAKRSLGTLAAVRGEEQHATELNREADEAFDAYLAAVRNASTTRREARDLRDGVRENSTLVLLGRGVVLNPARFDEVTDRSDRALGRYDRARREFVAAGAIEEADRTRAEQADARRALQVTKYTLFGSLALYGLASLALLVTVARRLYAYVRDARTASSGDFLVAAAAGE